VDLRVVAATHHDLAKLVDEQKFRSDLFFRLNVLPIHVPPLRERKTDIVVLAQHFLVEIAGPESIALSQGAVQRLTGYDWPGNVRELRNAMERVAALVRGPVIDTDDLRFLGRAEAGRRTAEFDITLLEGELAVAVEALERTMIKHAIAACAGNRAEAARRLGIHRQLLYKKLKQYGIE
jgi:two-component system NtrC family response regulator